MLLLPELGGQFIGADGRNPFILPQPDVLLPVAEGSRSVSARTRDVVDALATP